MGWEIICKMKKVEYLKYKFAKHTTPTFICLDFVVYYYKPGEDSVELGSILDYPSWKKKDLKWFDEEGYKKLYGGGK